MSLMRERLRELSPELWQSLENSWKIAMTNWLPKVDIGSKTDSSNSYPHLHNLENHLDRIILGFEEYHAQRAFDRALKLSGAEIYVICASILFHDLGRIYQNRDEINENLYLDKFIDDLIQGIIDKPERHKALNAKTKDLNEEICLKINKTNSENIGEIKKLLDELYEKLQKLKNRSLDGIIAKIRHVKNRPVPAGICTLGYLKGIKNIADEITNPKIAKDNELCKTFKSLRRLAGELNLVSHEHLRQLEDDILRTVAEVFSVSGKKSDLMEKAKKAIKTKLHKSNGIFILEKMIAVSPQHGYYTRRILIDENRYAELGIPSSLFAQVIAFVCEYHTNEEIPVPQTMVANPYGKIRCRELAALLHLIDDMDDSSTRVYSEYIKSIDRDDFKAVFRQKTGDVYLDPKRQTVFSVINDIEDAALLKGYKKVLSVKRKYLRKMKYSLACLGIYVYGWQLEHDEKIIIPGEGKQFYKDSYEACFYQGYLDNIVDCMWNLSTQIFGAGSFSYEQLAAKVCEKDIEKVKIAVYRISILSRAVIENDDILNKMRDKVGIWTGNDEWQWLMSKDKKHLCRFVTPMQLKIKIKEGVFEEDTTEDID